VTCSESPCQWQSPCGQPQVWYLGPRFQDQTGHIVLRTQCWEPGLRARGDMWMNSTQVSPHTVLEPESVSLGVPSPGPWVRANQDLLSFILSSVLKITNIFVLLLPPAPPNLLSHGACRKAWNRFSAAKGPSREMCISAALPEKGNQPDLGWEMCWGSIT
jgi:hypothetical protein